MKMQTRQKRHKHRDTEWCVETRAETQRRTQRRTQRLSQRPTPSVARFGSSYGGRHHGGSSPPIGSQGNGGRGHRRPQAAGKVDLVDSGRPGCPKAANPAERRTACGGRSGARPAAEGRCGCPKAANGAEQRAACGGRSGAQPASRKRPQKTPAETPADKPRKR